jgi:hypothetical protein
MPIRDENRSLYPKDWAAISLSIRRDRAGWRCEMMDANGEIGRCSAMHGEPHPITGSKVVLTVMHLDHDPTNNDPRNLLAACQRCHNAYDAPMRRAGIKARARASLCTPELPLPQAPEGGDG